MRRTIAGLFFLLALTFPLVASAHQPVVVTGDSPIVINQPEISKAYYGQLTGNPQIFQIHASSALKFYMNVLVPDLSGAKHDVSAAIIDTKNTKVPIAVIDGITGKWTPFFEPFARDTYFKGPEFRSVLPAGSYEIRVWSSNNDSPYALAVGEIESFGIADILNAYVTIPEIKSFFFHKPAYTAFLAPFLGAPILILLVIVLGVVYFGWRRKNKR